jgi:lycopene cyclase domain-containing protein
MNSLYLWLNIGSFSIPFLFSFHPRLKFYKKWKSLFLGILVMMAIFIPWDIIFTENGYWGFNPDYLTGHYLLGLPIEEWMFFICIPYACLFTHYALLELSPKFRFGTKATNVIIVSLVTVLIISLWYNYDRWYTFISFSYALLLLGIIQSYRKELLQPFLATYLVILIPFFIVNGVLTGTGIEDQVVWYNNDENLSLRMLTIPVEDTIYNLGMLLTVFFVMEVSEKRKEKE